MSSKLEKQKQLLNEELEEILTPLCNTTDLYELIRNILKVEGRDPTSTNSQKPWPLLPLVVADSILGNCEHVLPAAAAIQLLMAAGDVFDDIEDSDVSDSISSKYGTAIAANTGTTLLILAEKALTRLNNRGIDNETTLRVIDKINSFFTNACIGQHLDLSLARSVLNEGQYLDIVKLKSASQIECCCHAGAALSTIDNMVVDLFSVFGQNLGIMAQFSNDIVGVITKKDIIRRKPTLPMFFGFSHSDDKSSSILEKAFNPSYLNEVNTDQVKNVLFSSGGIQYTSIKMSFHRELAKETLHELEHRGISVRQLMEFLN
ncbi:MAG: polyprenyl synthetase family protein [Dehalogenimonas sp.]